MKIWITYKEISGKCLPKANQTSGRFSKDEEMEEIIIDKANGLTHICQKCELYS